MEEKNQNTDEYTGEYGNVIQRAHVEESPTESGQDAESHGFILVNSDSSPADPVRPGSTPPTTDASPEQEAASTVDSAQTGSASQMSDASLEREAISRPVDSARLGGVPQTDSSSDRKLDQQTAESRQEEDTGSHGFILMDSAPTADASQNVDSTREEKRASQNADSTWEERRASQNVGSTWEERKASQNVGSTWEERKASQRTGTSSADDTSRDISWEDHRANQMNESSQDGYTPFGNGNPWGSQENKGYASFGSGAKNQSTSQKDEDVPYHFRGYENEADKPVQKKKSGFGKRLAAVAGSAVLFGVLAAACFQGVCYFSSKVLGVNLTAASADIGYTTENVTYSNAATNMAIGTADVSGIVQQTMPAIVSITSTSEGQGTYDLFGQYYAGQDTVSAGTGFIVEKNDTELLIATNNHVVDGAKAISVQFADDEVYDATLKGNDASADLAVITVKLKDLKPATLKSIRIATLGDSSECKVGEMVIAIGNALGYGQSVTVGYVSARDREIQAEGENGEKATTMKVIQTDAAINPGNSGGPLLNMRGEVIGINSAKIAASSVEGVGYSIPISEADPIIDELMNREVLTDAQKGYLGISGKTVTEEASTFNMPEGVYVNEVAKGSGAEKSGIQKGDIITAINDIKVTTIESLKEKANSYKKGTKVTITLMRSSNGDYQEKKVDVVLQGESSIKDLDNGSNGNDDRSNGNGSDGRDGSSGNDDRNGSGNDDNGSGDYGSDDYGSDDFWGNFFPFGY